MVSGMAGRHPAHDTLADLAAEVGQGVGGADLGELRFHRLLGLRHQLVGEAPVRPLPDLTARGLMFPAGLASFALRKAHKSGIYSHEIAEVHFSEDFEQQFKAHPQAWEYFQTLAPSYKKPSINWVMSAKQEATKLNRLQALIEDSAKGTNKWKDNKYAKK